MKKILILLLLNIILFAQIAKVVAIRGDAFLQRGAQKIKIKIGSLVEKSDSVVTTKRAKLQLIFNDGTIITIGKNSNISMKDYNYDTANKTKNKATFGIKKGLFKVVTGKIGKMNPKKFKLKTKTSTIGIRGTELAINDKGAAGTTVGCTSGAIAVSSNSTGAVVQVPAGKMTEVKVGSDPAPATKYDPAAMGGADEESVESEDKKEAKEEKKEEKKEEAKEEKKEETKEEAKEEEKSEQKTTEKEEQKEETVKEETKEEAPAKEEQATKDEAPVEQETQEEVVSEDAPVEQEGSVVTEAEPVEEVAPVEEVDPIAEVEPIKEVAPEPIAEIAPMEVDTVEIAPVELDVSVDDLNVEVVDTSVIEQTVSEVAKTVTQVEETLNTDVIPPTITINTAGTLKDTTPTISGTTDDPTAVITVTINGKSYIATNNGSTWSLTLTQELIEDSSYTISVVAVDEVGNSSNKSSTIAINAIENYLPPITPLDVSGLELIINDSDNTGLSYMKFGYWAEDATNSVATAVDAYIAGFVTPNVVIEDYITQGSKASYTGNIRAILNGSTEATGTIGLDIDFAAKNVTGNINITDWESTINSGSVNSSGFNSSDISGSSSGVTSGSMEGYFFGPNAEEAGGKFELKKVDESAVGVFGAKK